jgi:hypothetical protein
MPSTEFLLFTVIVIFAVFVIINYNKDNTSEPTIKYVPVYQGQGGQQQSNTDVSDECVSPQCRQRGECICGRARMGYRNPIGPPSTPFIRRLDPLRRFDYDAVNDDFTPPFRRSYWDDYALAPGLYPTYTRGPPGRFRKVGTLIAQGVSANDKFKFLNVMGREKAPGSDFEYFATNTDTEQRVKFYIETRRQEISDGDMISINELEGYVYKFREDPDLSPRYDPYVI